MPQAIEERGAPNASGRASLDSTHHSRGLKGAKENSRQKEAARHVYLFKVSPAGRCDRCTDAEFIRIRLIRHLDNGQPGAFHCMCCTAMQLG